MNKIFIKLSKKIISIILIFGIFSTNIFAITPDYNSKIQDSGNFEEGKLFAILLEKKLSENSKIFNGVKKYGEYIQKKFPYLTSKIYLIDENENQKSIFSKLEYLYFNGEKSISNGKNKKNFLDGFFLIGDLPIPDIQIDDGFETKKSFFPYTDFEEKFFIFNDEEKKFVRQKEVSEPKSEIFFGFLKNSQKQIKNGINKEKFYENYFEKLNNFYSEGKKNFNENKIFFADTSAEKKFANQTMLSQYEKSLNYQYEISYKKFSSELAGKLQDDLISELLEPSCTKYSACVPCGENEKCNGEKKGNLTCEKGTKFEKEKIHCVKINEEILTNKIENSNLIGKFQIEKLLPEYTKVVNGFIQKSNDLIFKSGENKKNLKTIPIEIFVKDFLSRNYIQSVNQIFEEKIISDFSKYIENLENEIVADIKKWECGYTNNRWYSICNNGNYEKKLRKSISHNLQIKNLPTPKTIQKSIDEMDMNLEINSRNSIIFEKNREKRKIWIYQPKGCENYESNDNYGNNNSNGLLNNYCKRVQVERYFVKTNSKKYEFYLPNLFQSQGDLNKYSTAYLSYLNGFTKKIQKDFGGNYFDEEILEIKNDFQYFFNWIKIKDVNTKRKKILEEKIFNNSENFYLNKLENSTDGENLNKIEKFSTLYFRSKKFGEGENFYFEDIERSKNNSNNTFELQNFGDGDGEGNIDDKLKPKCGSYNGVPIPEWFSAVKCWLEDIVNMDEKEVCGLGDEESWDDFYSGDTFKKELDPDNEDNFDIPDNLEDFKKIIEIKNQKDYEFGGDFDYIQNGEELFFKIKANKVAIIKDGAYNSILLDFFTVDKNGNNVDFTGYANLKFTNLKNPDNGIISEPDLFFENGKARTGLISKIQKPIIEISRPGFKSLQKRIPFSKSWLAKDLLETPGIPENVQKINVNGTNFYSAFLFGNQYINLDNGIGFKLLESGKALSIASSINNYNFYNEDLDKMQKFENLKSGIEKSSFGIGFGDEEKSVMKFLASDFIGNSVKSENGIFSAILGDPLISFENEKNSDTNSDFKKTIGKQIYKFSGDVDKIEIIDFNSDGQDDILAFMKDGFIKLFKGEKGNFIKKGDLAFFSANVEKVFIGDTDSDGDQDFIIKLYDSREYFFENKLNSDGSRKFNKKLLSKSIIDKFLQGKTERFDIKKNILGEDDVRNNKYGKSDVQAILAKNWGIDKDGEYSQNENNLTTKEKLSKKIGEINQDLSEAVDFISNLTCMGGSCIGLPVNKAFMAPGLMTIPYNVGGMPLAYVGAPVPGSPVFGMTWYPGTPRFLGPCAGIACYMGTPGIPVYRHYIMPAITGGIGYAYCTGPATAIGAGGVCFITALPVNQLGICKQKDPLGDAVQDITQSFNEKSQAFKSGGKDGKNSMFSQMLGSGGIPENEDAYVAGIGKSGIKVFDENNKTMNGFGYLTRWWDKQSKEISVNMLDFPTIKLILPDLASGFGSITEGANEGYKGLINEKNKLTIYLNSLNKKESEDKDDKKSLFRKTGKVFSSEESIDSAKNSIKSTSKTIEESYDAIFAEIEKLPILQLKREKINLDIPWINPYQLNSMIIQIDEFIDRHEKILKDLPEEQFTYIRNYLKILKKNLEVLKTYRDLPQEIMKYRFLLSKYIGEVISIIDCIINYLGGWIIKNKKIAIAYIKLYYFIKQVMKAINNLSFVFDDFANTCSPCISNTYLSSFGIIDLFLSLIPTPPIIKMPKLPDIKLDLSDIQLGIIINIPEINFRIRELKIPALNLPTLAFGKLNLPMLKLPPAPKLPELPSIPAIEIPKLPNLPPAPKLPEFPSFITELTETIRLLFKIRCLVTKGLLVYPENTVKQIVEGLTNRSSSNYLPLDFMFLQFPNFSYSMIKEIQVSTKVDLKFEDETMFEELEKKADELNQTYKDLQNDINGIIGEFDKKVAEEGNKINEKTTKLFDGVNKSIKEEGKKYNSKLKNSMSW